MNRQVLKLLIPPLGLAVFSVSCVDHEAFSTPVFDPPPTQFKHDIEGQDGIRDDWWRLFCDPEFTRLIEKVDCDNFELKAAMARIERACALVGDHHSDRLPQINADGEITRIRQSENELGGPLNPIYLTRVRSTMALGWELDIWGRVQFLVNAAQADTAALVQAREDLRLTLKGQLSRNYMAARFLDREAEVLRQSIEIREENLKLARDLFEAGFSSELDVTRAQTELSTARAALERVRGERYRFENAIATLAGINPSSFCLPQAVHPTLSLPSIRTDLPIKVLANRPDVRQAMAELRAAHERVGSAKAEFFPRINLMGSAGLTSISAENFLDWSSRQLTLGPTVSLPVFQGGRLTANQKRAEAEVNEALADYQQSVIEAFQEIEDALADLAAARLEREAQEEGLEAADRSIELSQIRYQEGLVSSLEVIDATREQLSVARAIEQLKSREFQATITLIQALGGGLKCGASEKVATR